jgi:hypothetical protein
MQFQDGPDAGIAKDLLQLVIPTITREIREEERVLSIFRVSVSAAGIGRASRRPRLVTAGRAT